ncbi:MAG TPA: nicotinate (nicotinamide) nucleotide adenylyltransferase, partial [Candidatus Saccharimonadales bacterium]|nr:nicotinate (nicotinamide) nucleotide adenylyltransferase [Candidatus Saccharimonadales bacterium]
MKLGILGGTFDPVHNGHLALAEAAARRAALDRVLLVPCARPPHKDRTGLTDGYQRYAMLALAADGSPGLAVSPLELLRGGISFTAETLGEISAERPGADLFLLVGSDSFVEMETWRDLDRILALAAVLVLHRPGAGARDPVDAAPAALKGRILPPGEALPAPARQALPLAA